MRKPVHDKKPKQKKPKEKKTASLSYEVQPGQVWKSIDNFEYREVMEVNDGVVTYRDELGQYAMCSEGGLRQWVRETPARLA